MPFFRKWDVLLRFNINKEIVTVCLLNPVRVIYICNSWQNKRNICMENRVNGKKKKKRLFL